MERYTKWKDVSLIVSSAYRKKVLEKVQSPRMPTTLSKELEINKAHISRALKQLSERKLIECKNPETKKGRIFEITAYGKKILKEAESVYGKKSLIR